MDEPGAATSTESARVPVRSGQSPAPCESDQNGLHPVVASARKQAGVAGRARARRHAELLLGRGPTATRPRQYGGGAVGIYEISQAKTGALNSGRCSRSISLDRVRTHIADQQAASRAALPEMNVGQQYRGLLRTINRAFGDSGEGGRSGASFQAPKRAESVMNFPSSSPGPASEARSGGRAGASTPAAVLRHSARCSRWFQVVYFSASS